MSSYKLDISGRVVKNYEKTVTHVGSSTGSST